MKFFLNSKKGGLYLLIAAVLVTAFGYGGYRIATQKSPEYTKSEEQIKQVIISGWPLKHIAGVEQNRDGIEQFRELMQEYYSDEGGELARQRRFITLFTDNVAVEDGFSDAYNQKFADESQAIINFEFTDIKFDEISIKKDRATVNAKVEYFIERRVLNHGYGTVVSNKYRWELKKLKDRWLIEKEDLLLKDN